MGGKIIDKCIGCKKIIDDMCTVYINPAGKWQLGGCGVATHIEKKDTQITRKTNPIKLSKKKSKRS